MAWASAITSRSEQIGPPAKNTGVSSRTPSSNAGISSRSAGALSLRAFVAVVDERVDEQMDGLVSAVGQGELVQAGAEMAGQVFERVAVFGIDAEVGGGEIALDEIDDVRRSADSVLVEIEP